MNLFARSIEADPDDRHFRDLRDPERVYQGDFVLRLTEGVNRLRETLRDYVVTQQLRVWLRRLGRIGRREGTRRNCLFLATSEESLLRTLGLLKLWSEGHVDPVRPPPKPYQIVAQQLMALALQDSGAGPTAWTG